MMFKKIKCPKCQKRLFDADTRAVGKIYAYCRSCRKSVLIDLKRSDKEWNSHGSTTTADAKS